MSKQVRIYYEIQKSKFLLWKEHASRAAKVLAAVFSVLLFVGAVALIYWEVSS